MREFVLISAGAILGANLRYWLATLFNNRFGPLFPYGTLFINITGSFLLGFVLTIAAGRASTETATTLRLLVGTGFLGAYTTFSAFSVEAVTLVLRGDIGTAFLYSGGSLLGSLAAAYVGMLVARLFV